MRKQVYWITTCLAFTLTVGAPSLSNAIEDAIIAIVNDELITLKDLKDYGRSSYVSLVAEGANDEYIRAYMKDLEVTGTNKLIEDKLILSKANNVGIIVRPVLIDERVEDLKKKYGSEQNLVNALVKGGATMTDLRNKIRDQLKIKFIVEHEVKSKIYVNPQEVTNFYEQNKSLYMEEDRINLQSIFIAFGKNKKAALSKAVKVFKYAVAHNDFEKLVEQYSDASSIGVVQRGQLLPHVEEIVFNLGLNNVSPLVELDNGIYIFKLTGETSAKVANLEKVRDSIYDQIFRDKFKNKFTDWLENLKEDAFIEIKK